MARREKCDQCKMWHGGFHICLDLSTPEPPLKKKSKGFNGGTQHSGQERTEEHCEALSESMKKYWAAKSARDTPRNERLIERYKTSPVSVRSLATEFGISKDKVLRILHDAQDRGLVTMRKPGQVLAKGAE